MTIRKIFILTETNKLNQRKTIGAFDFIQDAKERAEQLHHNNPYSHLLIEFCIIGGTEDPITALTWEPKILQENTTRK